MIWPFSRPFSLVNARVVGSQGVFAGSVRISGSRIVSLDQPGSPKEKTVDLGGAYVLPGLINAHDHLLHNNYPRSKWQDRYLNVRQWIEDVQAHLHQDPALAIPLALATPHKLLTSGLKNLLSGTTTVCHHDPMPRRWPTAFLVRVVRSYHFSHSLMIDGDSVPESFQGTPESVPWIIHAAEGTDDEAAGEVGRLAELGCLGSNTVLVHGVGAGAEDRKRIQQAGCGLVWCPSSNDYLFGKTADVAELSEAHQLALGTDSRLTGAGDLLDEMRVAAETGQISPEAIFRAVTIDAASVLGLSTAGRLVEGGPADFFVVPKIDSDPFSNLLEIRRADVELVVLGGLPMVASRSLAAVFRAAGAGTVRTILDGRPKLLSRRVARKLKKREVSETGFETPN